MTPQDWIGLALVYAIIATSVAVALFLDRKNLKIDSRKVIHIGVGAFVLVWWMFSENWIMFVFFALPFAIVLLLAMFDGNPISKSHLGSVANDQGHRYGLFLYVVSIGLMIVFFWEHWTAATIGIVAMTVGDGFGSVIGRRFGKHPTVNGKSLEGTIGVFTATFVAAAFIMIYYGWLTSMGFYPSGDSIPLIPIWAASLIAGAIASILEMVCPGEYDNILIPVVTASAMVLLGL